MKIYGGEYRRQLKAETALTVSLSEADKLKHRRQLEANVEEWVKFFFPASAKCPFAPFHKKFFKRVVGNPEWYEVLSWSRELSKTTCTMFVVIYLALTGRKKNVLLISSSYDNAQRLLEPYRANLDANQRIALYYGEQKNIGSWEAGEFRTRGGATFRACGALQSPRGTKTIDDVRPDCILMDDFDTDEEVRNPATIAHKWDWFEQAVYGTRSISNDCLILWCGNIIAQDCCITRAGAMADSWDVVNIRDSEGRSAWPEKNSEERIDRALSKITTRSQQQEYFNNPLSEGEIFKEITWGKCPPLGKLDFAVCYLDPSPSNKDKPKKGVSYKATFLVGHYEGKFYIYYGFLEQAKTADFIMWCYAVREYVRERTQVFYYIENNTLQNPFYEQVYIPKFQEVGAAQGYIPITPDTRDKADKAARIEGNLEGLNHNGMLVFNEAEKDNPHMKRLAEQFLLFIPQLKAPADGPDCIEGAVWILNQKIQSYAFKPSYGKIQHKNLY
ncbi:MAG: hypothetical protein LBL94_10080 [Prevotellaceae bacterium]|nr:hypothetical protein [Prevotellaceae bacterium]